MLESSRKDVVGAEEDNIFIEEEDDAALEAAVLGRYIIYNTSVLQYGHGHFATACIAVRFINK